LVLVAAEVTDTPALASDQVFLDSVVLILVAVLVEMQAPRDGQAVVAVVAVLRILKSTALMWLSRQGVLAVEVEGKAMCRHRIHPHQLSFHAPIHLLIHNQNNHSLHIFHPLL
jgi:hypothetical protein